MSSVVSLRNAIRKRPSLFCQDSDRAIFSYSTDDRIHDGSEDTCSKAILRVTTATGVALREPFILLSPKSPDGNGPGIIRNLDKSVYGNPVGFEEVTASLDRLSLPVLCHGRGCEFESRRPRHTFQRT